MILVNCSIRVIRQGLSKSLRRGAATLFKPDIRLRANQPSSERTSQSDERKDYFGTRSCVRANLVMLVFV